MNQYPDFSEHGYRIEQILGSNSTGGRVTYLAQSLKISHPVVIKQYQFAQPGSPWVGYRAYEGEIRVLRSLYCENIPRYLDSFETTTGFCLVQEYKRAPALSARPSLPPETIKDLAIALLEVLAYLQEQNPPVIHGDLTPDNILLDPETLRVYLVDFGFARIGSGNVAISNAIKGTIGFMPPEELFNRQLTKASDLYSLGVTLICLLIQKPATEISQLIAEKNNRLNFKPYLPPLHPQFVQWLEKMIEPSKDNRFPNALVALRALQPLPVLPHTQTQHRATETGRDLPSKWLVRLGLLATVGLFTVGALRYWQGQPKRQLLSSKACPKCNLRNLQLPQGNLKGANLEGANLETAFLREANLEKANLQGANLQRGFLKEINLIGANLEGANLQQANLSGANLSKANLEGANLEGANLEDANLEGANLQYSNLVDSKLRYSRLSRANLQGANLGGTSLEGTILKGTIMPDGSLKK